MEVVKGWQGVRTMQQRPVWGYVIPTAVLTPVVVRHLSRGDFDQAALIAWPFGIIVLAMLAGGEAAKVRKGAHKFEYVGMLALLGGFVGMPALILGIPAMFIPGVASNYSGRLRRYTCTRALSQTRVARLVSTNKGKLA